MEDGQQGFTDFMSLAQLGTQTFLANQVITAERPSTYQVNQSGQMIVSGGGANSPLSNTNWMTVAGIVGVFIFLALLFRMLGGHK